MGNWRNLLIEIEDRGYGLSDKCVCICDGYLVKKILQNGEVREQCHLVKTLA